MFSFLSRSRPCVLLARSALKHHPSLSLSLAAIQRRQFCAQNDDEKHIRELKDMFKDDPRLDTWLKEIEESDNKTSTEQADSKPIDIDAEMLRYNIEEFYSTSAETFIEDAEVEEHQLPISSERKYHIQVNKLNAELGKKKQVLREP